MKNIIFDLDGTLWNTTEIVALAWNKAIKEAGISDLVITPSILRGLFGKPMDEIADNLFPKASENKKSELLKLCCKYEHEELEKTNINLMYTGTKETLEQLSKKHKLFIVSNCQSGYIELFMRKTGIKKYITDFECYGDTLKSKGENISLVIKRNKLDDVIYVGDTQGDYEATIVAKVPFVFASYGFGNPEKYDFKINEIKDLLMLENK